MAPYAGPPVVVIGNGPVGQTTALLLARWGIPVLLLDALPWRQAGGSRSICQQRDVIDIWDSVGAAKKIAREGVTWTVASTFFRGEPLFEVEFKDPGRSPWPPWVNLPQSRVEEILDERIAEMTEAAAAAEVAAAEAVEVAEATAAAAASEADDAARAAKAVEAAAAAKAAEAAMAASAKIAKIEVLWNHAVTGMHQTEDQVVVEVAGPEGPTWIQTPYVVACAGAHGDVVREALGVRFEGHSYPDQFLICDIKTSMVGRGLERQFHFDPEWNPGRQVLIHPGPESTYRIDWQVEPEFDLAAEEADGRLDERIRKVIGEQPYELLWRTVYRFHSKLVDTMAVGRVLLAGDCAHLMAPFGARGLNSGVADAENAAWKIAFVLHGWADETIMGSYDLERRAAAQDNLAITTATMDFLVPQTEQGRAHREDVLERAVDDEGARAEINSGRLYTPFRYGNNPHPEVGNLVPDLQFGQHRLREIARQGLLVMLRDDADYEMAQEMLAAYAAPSRIVIVPEDEAKRLKMRHWEAWLVRPDAHVSAVADTDNLDRLIPQLLHFPV